MARWRFGRREDRGSGINEGGRKGKAEEEEWGFLDLFFGRFLFCIYGRRFFCILGLFDRFFISTAG